MTRTRKVLLVAGGLLAIGVISLAWLVSYEEPCSPAPPPAGDVATMKATVHRCYGGPEVIELVDVEKPVPADGELLVKVHAAAANPLDYHYLRGKPYVMRLESGLGTPRSVGMGVDFAGTVEAVGPGVTRFRPGDAVFGGRTGAFAEYVVVREDRAVAAKPPAVGFEQAAAVPIAGLTALQGLRDRGGLEAGDKVLVNGASGGVGTFAVQIAKAYGAEVTGVCSTRNVEMVRSLGADHVIDYTQADYTEGDARYDLILDNVGNRSLSDNRRVMAPDGVLVMVGGPKEDPWIGPLLRPAQALLMSPFVDEELAPFLARLTREDLELMAGLMADGKVTPVIDRRYRLAEVPEAIGYLEEGHARGKVIITLD